MKIEAIKYGLAACLMALASVGHAGDINAGKMKAAACAGCHGSDGMGLSQEYPNLAGQKKLTL